jgi:hypothetical protein
VLTEQPAWLVQAAVESWLQGVGAPVQVVTPVLQVQPLTA